MLKQDEFFDSYKKSVKKKEGIPGFRMNKPLAINSLPGTIGLELEIECQNNLPRDDNLELIPAGKTTKARWLGVRDGSLRGNSLEYIFSQPCTREELAPLVKGLFDCFKNFKSKLDNSNRCSTHVHINMANKTINQLTSTIILWAIFEEALIDWCGEERKTNHFCLSMKDSSSLLVSWEAYLRTGGARVFDRNMKYSALNILPIFEKGSFEFRCGRASSDPVFPTTWATFLDTFVAFACNKYVIPSRIANDMSEQGAYEIFMDICKDAALADFKNDVVKMAGGVDAFNDKCFKNFRNVQSLVLGFPWEKWIELIDKAYVPNPFEKEGKSMYLNRIPTLATAPRVGGTGARDRRGLLVDPAEIIRDDVDRQAMERVREALVNERPFREDPPVEWGRGVRNADWGVGENNA